MAEGRKGDAGLTSSCVVRLVWNFWTIVGWPSSRWIVVENVHRRIKVFKKGVINFRSIEISQGFGCPARPILSLTVLENSEKVGCVLMPAVHQFPRDGALAVSVVAGHPSGTIWPAETKTHAASKQEGD